MKQVSYVSFGVGDEGCAVYVAVVQVVGNWATEAHLSSQASLDVLRTKETDEDVRSWRSMQTKRENDASTAATPMQTKRENDASTAATLSATADGTERHLRSVIPELLNPKPLTLNP